MNRDHNEKGFTVVDGASSAYGKFYGLLILADTVINTVTFSTGYAGHSAIAGKTLPKGAYVPMRFTALTLTSGTALCLHE